MTMSRNRGETVQSRANQNWSERELIVETMVGIERICQFLREFDASCRHKLSHLSEKLTSMEHKVTYLEAWLNLPQDQKEQIGTECKPIAVTMTDSSFTSAPPANFERKQ